MRSADLNVAGGEITTGRVSVTEMNGEEIVRAGITVVGYVEGESNSCSSNLPTASDVRLVSIKGE